MDVVVCVLSGGITFIVTFNAMIDPAWFSEGVLKSAAEWMVAESPNPWSCAAMGELVSLTLTVVVSKLTQPLPGTHIQRMFGSTAES